MLIFSKFPNKVAPATALADGNASSIHAPPSAIHAQPSAVLSDRDEISGSRPAGDRNEAVHSDPVERKVSGEISAPSSVPVLTGALRMPQVSHYFSRFHPFAIERKFDNIPLV